MIRYIVDKNKKYEQNLKNTIREYNEQFTGQVKFKDLYVYAVTNGIFMGGIQLSCGWNWASVKKVYYQNQSILKKLIDNVLKSLDSTMLGIKFFTAIEQRYIDFISVGFKLANHLKNTGVYKDFYYANYIKPDNIATIIDSDIIISESPVSPYQEVLNQQEANMDALTGFDNQTGDTFWVALDDDLFVGAICGDYYDKVLYLDRLAVIPSYRHHGIGKQLMLNVENEARSKNVHFIEFGTTSFQARSFYEKLGYRVIHTMKDYPKGYESYTLFKDLSKN